MATSARTASWDIPVDRKASAVWLGLIWIGMVVGFGSNIPFFLREKPPAAGLVYLHAVVFVSWLVLISAQVTFVLRGRMTLHRRLGSKLGYVALLMVPLGLATGLTSAAQGHEAPRFIVLHVVDIFGFIAFIALGLMYRARPAAHKRLMILALVSIADPGFARALGPLLRHFALHPMTPLEWFIRIFYGNVILVTAMFSWDLWRRRRVHPALLAGGASLIGAELLTAFVYFNPTWIAIATSIVHAWGYTGGMP